MAFELEDKIKWEELAPSLQKKIQKIRDDLETELIGSIYTVGNNFRWSFAPGSNQEKKGLCEINIRSFNGYGFTIDETINFYIKLPSEWIDCDKIETVIPNVFPIALSNENSLDMAGWSFIPSYECTRIIHTGIYYISTFENSKYSNNTCSKWTLDHVKGTSAVVGCIKCTYGTAINQKAHVTMFYNDIYDENYNYIGDQDYNILYNKIQPMMISGDIIMDAEYIIDFMCRHSSAWKSDALIEYEAMQKEVKQLRQDFIDYAKSHNNTSGT